MLRRTERIVLKEDDETPAETPFVAEPAIATGPQPDRRNLEMWLNEVEKAGERQKAEKKGIDALRAEVQRTIVTSEGEVISNSGSVWRALLKPSRLALLVLALVAGGVAAYFATTMNEAAPADPVVVAEPVVVAPPPPPPPVMEQILVASKAMPTGGRLTAATVEWKAWPTDAMRDDYITQAAVPGAIEQMADSIVRFEFFPGEPIRTQKLVSPGDGYLSAVLEPGELGVSISVQPDIAAGGFIQPNDHVDVLLTQAIGGRQVAQTVLANVRVLAIAHRLGEMGPAPAESSDGNPDEVTDDAGTAPATFSEGVVATLALNSEQAEIITSARNAGSLSLVLRSMSDFSTARAEDSDELTANQQIKLTSPFWTN